MGAWGIGPFDNNDASDWVYELTDEENDWLAQADQPAIRAHAGSAATALDRVLADSELAELFDETGDDSWRQMVGRLRDAAQ